jgi:hypothetical protein
MEAGDGCLRGQFERSLRVGKDRAAVSSRCAGFQAM